MAWLKLLVRKYSTFSRLSKNERSLLLQSLYLLPLTAIMLRLCGLHFTQTALSYLPRQPDGGSAPIATQSWTTLRMVRLAARYSPAWTNCLKQSLVLWLLLRNQGIVSDLKIGVRQEAGQFAAHAWVEYQGLVLNDVQSVHLQFIPFQHSFGIEV